MNNEQPTYHSILCDCGCRDGESVEVDWVPFDELEAGMSNMPPSETGEHKPAITRPTEGEDAS